MGSSQLRWSFVVPAPVERVGRVLCSEAYSLAEARLREDVISAAYRVTHEEPGRLEFEIAYVEYGRSRTGGIDRRRTGRGRTLLSWEGSRGLLRWAYESESSTRISISGSYQLAAQGEHTHVDYVASVEVRVPVIGGQIAKMVLRELEQGKREMIELLTRHVATAP